MVVEGEEETTTCEMDEEELLVVVVGRSDVVLSWWRCWHWSIGLERRELLFQW